MKTIKNLLSILFLGLIMISCNQDSLQKFMVDSYENENFIAFDFPASLLQADKSGLDQDEIEVYNSIKKVNVVALQFENTDQQFFNSQEDRLKKIFKDSAYQELMKFNTQGMAVSVYFTGNEDAIDEIILFGYKNGEALGVARVLGKKMDIAKIMDVANKIEIDPSSLPVDNIEAFFTN
ncbi:MAG: DUF4252 domain-containing protein [Flavobacteriaceae bacterium]